MIFKIQQGFKNENWHYWFAWYPVRLDSDRVAWLQMVERKREAFGYPVGLVCDYRLPGEKNWVDTIWNTNPENFGERW